MIRSLSSRVFALAALASIGAAGCGPVNNPEEPPAGTRMIPFAGDPFADTGIRPDPEAMEPTSAASGGIIIEWRSVDPAVSGGAPVGGYYVYRSDSSDANGTPAGFVRIARIPRESAGGDTLFSDEHAPQNVRCSYLVKAYAKLDASLESAPSDTVSFTLLERPVSTAPRGDISLPDGAPLRLEFTGPGYVALRVDEILPENETVVLRRMWRYTGQVTDFSDPHVDYAGEPLVPGRRYRWRVDRIIQGSPQANASRWLTFSVK
jgi:hypothetical protein